MQPRHLTCLNCGSEEVGRYCAACGQRQRGNHRSIAQFGYDFFEDFRHYDHRLWRTLFLLAFRPGLLTREFNAGRRARYLHPRQMYFFVSVVFFLLLSLLGSNVHLFDIERTAHRHPHDFLQAAQKVAQKAGEVGDNLEQQALGLSHEYIGSDPPLAPLGLKARIDQRFQTLRHMDRALLRERFTHRVSSNLPRVAFFLLPVFAALLMLFFGSKHWVYVEHLVFAFHAHIYLFIIATVCLIVEAVTNDSEIATLGLLFIIPYWLLSLRKVYRQAWETTVLKFIGLCTSYGLILAAAVTAMAGITLWFV